MTSHAPRRGVAVVTGGGAWVGRAVVRRLAETGFDIGVLARGDAGLVGAVADVEQRGRRGLALPVDVADAELGPIDVWVKNARQPRRRWPPPALAPAPRRLRSRPLPADAGA